MKKDQNLKVSIVEINEISYKQSHSPIPMDQIVFGENLIFGLGFNFNIDLENDNFKLSSLIRFIIEGFEEPIIELETEIIFDITNLSNVVKKEKEGEFDIDDSLLATLTGVSIGTSRGILAKNTKGTPFSKYPLPLLNPSEILKDIENRNKESK